MKVHAHVLDIIRARLGRSLADRLVSDALIGGDGAVLHLERVAGVRTHVRRNLPHPVLGIWVPLERGSWAGDVLVLPGLLPQTVMDLLPGRRVGDVVEGSGADDLVIQRVSTFWSTAVDAAPPPVTHIAVEQTFLGARDIRLSVWDRLTRPLRLMARWSVLTWRGQPHERMDIRTRETLPVYAGIALFLGLMLLVAGVVILARWIVALPWRIYGLGCPSRPGRAYTA